MGVSWYKASSKWEVSIYINQKPVYLGRYKNEKFAGDIYLAALKNINNYNGNNKEFMDSLKGILSDDK